LGAQQRMRQLNPKAPLAHSRWPDEQIRASQPARRQCPAELLHHRVVPKDAVPHAKPIVPGISNRKTNYGRKASRSEVRDEVRIFLGAPWSFILTCTN